VFRLTHRTGSPVIEFAGHDLVRAYVSPYDAGFDIWEFDLRSGQLRDTGKHFWASSDRLDGRSRILTGWEGSAFAQLLNRDTGRRLAAIPNDAWPQGPSALEAAPVFLSDGSVAAPVYTVQLDPLYRTPLRPSESRREVANFSGDDGHRLAGVALGPWEVQRIEGGDRHRVLVTARSTTASNTTLAWVDFDRGVFQPIGVDVQRPIVDPERPLPKEILCETGTSVVAWNPSSGALRVVAGN
jgi:hypothetical protein